MAIKTEVRLSLEGLNKLAAEADNYRTRVGVLGDKVNRQHVNPGDPLTNSEIGMINIFGSYTRNIPARDFLLMPIEYNKHEIMRKMHSVKIKAAIARGDIKGVFKLLGTIAEGFVQQAFETAGFGQWAPNAPATIDKKGSAQPLIDWSELRRAVTSDVKRKGEL